MAVDSVASVATEPRVRFAPSPTGFLHVGGARTALFNWLYARHTGGTLVLRIEDTDTERTREEWVHGIQSTLRWLGLDWDEGPYRQSERAGLYEDAVARLIESGRAYRCDCTSEQIKERTKDNATPGYDGFCRDRNVAAGEGVSVRFRTPDEGTTTFTDVVRGDITVENATLEDFVKQVSNLIAGAVKEFGDSTKTALAFQTSASAFVAPAAVPSSFGQAGSWQVRPQPNNSGQPYNPTNGRG